MSQASPFRRNAARQYPLVADALIDFTDLLTGAPVLTAATAKIGISDAGDVNSAGIAAGTGTSLSGIAFNIAEIPAGAIITDGAVYALTGFNSATSDTLTIAIASGATLLNASTTALRTTGGVTALSVATAAVQYVSSKITATWTGVGTAPSAGKFYVQIQYVIPGRALENQGL